MFDMTNSDAAEMNTTVTKTRSKRASINKKVASSEVEYRSLSSDSSPLTPIKKKQSLKAKRQASEWEPTEDDRDWEHRTPIEKFIERQSKVTRRSSARLSSHTGNVLYLNYLLIYFEN